MEARGRIRGTGGERGKEGCWSSKRMGSGTNWGSFAPNFNIYITSSRKTAKERKPRKKWP